MSSCFLVDRGEAVEKTPPLFGSGGSERYGHELPAGPVAGSYPYVRPTTGLIAWFTARRQFLQVTFDTSVVRNALFSEAVHLIPQRVLNLEEGL